MGYDTVAVNNGQVSNLRDKRNLQPKNKVDAREKEKKMVS